MVEIFAAELLSPLITTLEAPLSMQQGIEASASTQDVHQKVVHGLLHQALSNGRSNWHIADTWTVRVRDHTCALDNCLSVVRPRGNTAKD